MAIQILTNDESILSRAGPSNALKQRKGSSASSSSSSSKTTIDLAEDEMLLSGMNGNVLYGDSNKNPYMPSIILIVVTAMASACMYTIVVRPVIRNLLIVPNSSSSSTATSVSGATTYASPHSDFYLANSESYGFFDDISSSDWALMKTRVKTRQNHLYPKEPTKDMVGHPSAWYMNNFQPDFTCLHERRVGGMGYGSKWVCDPHRIYGYTNARVAEPLSRENNDCLIYSIGSVGNFDFERGLQDVISEKNVPKKECEVHVFDMKDFSGEDVPSNIQYHLWGIKSSAIPDENVVPNMKTFQETVKELGHEGRVVDVLKISCGGCEWKIYKDLMQTDIKIMQDRKSVV